MKSGIFGHRALRKLSVGLMLVSLFALSGCTETQSEDPIRLGGIPLDDQQDAAGGYRILADLITEATGRKVEFFDTSDYASVTEALLAGQIDIAQLPSIGYVVARSRNEKIEILGVGARDGGKLIGSHTYGITRIDNSSINSLQDIAGKTVCFSDPSSSAGYLWPSKSILEAGLNPVVGKNPDFDVQFVGSFPQVASSIELGDCEAGFILDSFFDKTLKNSDIVNVENLRIFWKSPVSPGSPLVFDSDAISQNEAQAIREILVEKGNKDYLVSAGVCTTVSDCKLLSASAWGYVLAEDQLFDSIRELCSRLELEQC